MNSEASELEVQRHGSTTVLTIDRPEAFNSLSPGLLVELPEALRAAGADRSCRAVIVTGKGERAFCAGIDVKSVAKRDANDAAAGATGNGANGVAESGSKLDPITAGFENLHLVLSGIVRIIHTLPIPVISAVNGHAIGAGFAIAAASDLRLGSSNATFADGFVKRGISGCEMGLSYFLPKIVGPALAFDLMMTGRRIGADQAREMGLLSEVVDHSDLIDSALKLADALAENSPMAISMTKEVMWANLHASSLDHALALESRSQVMTRNTADAAEARNSFLEKRSPVFDTPSGDRPLR
ncbi:MAG: enoyl-CoA hydratase/isomerase family protein [Acidimicrobiales bacterium]